MYFLEFFWSFASAPLLAAITQTEISPTHAPEVSGTVLLDGGMCCAGSTAGETITVRAASTASSSQGDVVEMRVVSGRSQVSMEEMAQVPWEPYMQEKSFPVDTISGWIGFRIHVQFRDAEGNISPIYAQVAGDWIITQYIMHE